MGKTRDQGTAAGIIQKEIKHSVGQNPKSEPELHLQLDGWQRLDCEESTLSKVLFDCVVRKGFGVTESWINSNIQNPMIWIGPKAHSRDNVSNSLLTQPFELNDSFFTNKGHSEEVAKGYVRLECHSENEAIKGFSVGEGYFQQEQGRSECGGGGLATQGLKGAMILINEETIVR